MTSSAIWIPAGAVLLSLVLRAVYYSQILGNPYFDSPIMDEGYHDEWAREIAAGDLASRLPFFRAPLYPFLLGAAYRVLGPDFGVIRAIQLAVGAITPALTYWIARRVAPRRHFVATGSALLVALDGMLYYFEGDLLLESLLAPLAAALVLLMLRAGETGTRGRWLGVGLVLGVFAITRPNILLFAPVAFVLALVWKGRALDWRRRRLLPALALTAGTCAIVLPITFANWIGGGDRVLVASQAGLNFFLGNNAEANGWSATAPSLFRIDWWGGYEDAMALAEDAQGRELEPSEVSDYWFQRALEWWRENPGPALGLTLRKLVLFFSAKEFGNNRDIYLFFREFAPMATPSAHLLWLIMPLSLIGSVALWRRGESGGRALVLFVGVYVVSVVLFFVTARYRVPLRPMLTVLAFAGVDAIRQAFVVSRSRTLLVGGCAALAAVGLNVNPWIAAYEPSRAQFYQSVANVHHEKGELAEALRLQQRALEIDSTYPKGNLNLGTLYMALGNPQAAVSAFERERLLDPEDGQNLASLAQAYDRSGRLEEAERTYSAAEAAGLADPPALYNHAVCLERLGKPEGAGALYRRAVEIAPGFADAWNNLGVLEARAGRLEEAIRYWEKTLEVRPGDPRARENLQRARERLAGGERMIPDGLGGCFTVTGYQAAGRWALFVALFVGGTTAAEATTLRVPGDHITIQAAVHAAAAGDTVLVAPGEYSEFIQMRNGVVLRSSDGPEQTTLQTPGLGADMLEARIIECLEGIDRSTVIEGFRFDSGDRVGCAIYCESGSPTIRGNIIQGFGWGINLRNSKARVEENTIEGCRSFGMLVFASSPEIFRNVIRNNAPFGISISGKDSFPLIGGSRERANKIYGNPQGVSNQTRNDIDATWNDWGWEITAVMEDKGYPYDITAIADGNDFSRAARGKGKVDYRNWIRPPEEPPGRSPFAGILTPILIALGIAVALVVIFRRNRAAGSPGSSR